MANHVGGLLISGNGTFVRYLTQKMKGGFEVGSYTENDATYLGVRITKMKMGISKGRF